MSLSNRGASGGHRRRRGAPGALVVLVTWVAGLLGLPIPPEVAAAVTTLVTFVPALR